MTASGPDRALLDDMTGDLELPCAPSDSSEYLRIWSRRQHIFSELFRLDKITTRSVILRTHGRIVIRS